MDTIKRCDLSEIECYLRGAVIDLGNISHNMGSNEEIPGGKKFARMLNKVIKNYIMVCDEIRGI